MKKTNIYTSKYKLKYFKRNKKTYKYFKKYDILDKS